MHDGPQFWAQTSWSEGMICGSLERQTWHDASHLTRPVGWRDLSLVTVGATIAVAIHGKDAMRSPSFRRYSLALGRVRKLQMQASAARKRERETRARRAVK